MVTFEVNRYTGKFDRVVCEVSRFDTFRYVPNNPLNIRNVKDQNNVYKLACCQDYSDEDRFE